jgi:hypothetical protein
MQKHGLEHFQATRPSDRLSQKNLGRSGAISSTIRGRALVARLCRKSECKGVQRLVNRQARAITGMFSTSPVGPLVREAALTPAEALLDDRQLSYTTRLIGLPGDQPTKQVLPVTLREGDRYAQPGEQPAEDRA